MKSFPLILVTGSHGHRVGNARGLTELEGRPWIDHQLRRFAASNGHRAVVVLGQDHLEYRRALPWMETARDGTVEVDGLHVMVVIDDHPERGYLSEVQAGARVLEAEKLNGVYVLPVDVPAAAPEVWSHLRNSLTGDVSACIPRHGGRDGFPILFSRRYLSTLMDMPPDSELHTQLGVLPKERLWRLAVDDPSVTMHLATQEQWLRFVLQGES